MEHEPENLLESDRIEDVLEDDGLPPPVVVVQDRSKVLPSLLIIGAIVILALGSAFGYREVVRSRRQAEFARRDWQRAIERAKEEENLLKLKMLPTPAAPPEVFATGPTPTDSVSASPVLVAAGPGIPGGPQAPGPLPSPGPQGSGASSAGDPNAASASAEAGPPESGSPARRPRVLTHLTGGAEPVGTPGSRPTAPIGPSPAPGLAATGQPSGSSPPIAAAGGPSVASPFDELNGSGDPGRAASRVDVATAPASAAADPKAVAATPADPAPAEPPLPSREETERQIRAEAAAIKQDDDQRLEQQQQEIRGLRDDERRQFLDELRVILKAQGRRAGPEIERLSNRFGRTENPALLMRARVVIAETQLPLRDKVHKLREYGVPESVILDYLANRLDKDRGARNGPRTHSDVLYQAGKNLLHYYDLDEHRPAEPPAAPIGRPGPEGSPRSR